jgi:hypothetical protein
MQAKSLRIIECDFSTNIFLSIETFSVSFLRLRLSIDFSSLSNEVDALDISYISSFGKPL